MIEEKLKLKFIFFILILVAIKSTVGFSQNCFALSGRASAKIKYMEILQAHKKFRKEKKSKIIKIVNINKATLIELITLPSIGKVRAKNIIFFRKVNGNFTSISELARIKGIGKKIIKKIRPFIILKDKEKKKISRRGAKTQRIGKNKNRRWEE
ncbi:helix-hairpin-helix domain-containing protein [bacterium]|nr:helix-hairpin-helix domain-containing protein [bacterium]